MPWPIHTCGILNQTETGKWRTKLQYKASLKEAKDIFVEMDLYYLGSLNFFNTEFYSPQELGLCTTFKPWEMYQEFIHQDQLGTEFLESLLLEQALKEPRQEHWGGLSHG